MNFSWVAVLSSIVLFQLTLLTLFLFFGNTGKRLSNRILGSFFLWLALNIGDGLLSFYGFYQQYPSWAHLEDTFIFLLGPMLYFYTRSMIFKDFKFERRDLLHATPFLVLTLVFQIYYHVKPASSQRDIQEAIIQQDLPVQFYFVMLLVYTHVYVYIFKAWKELAKYRLHIKEKFSEVGTINLGWLAFMLTAVGMILVMSLIFTFSPLVKPGEMDNKILIVPFLFILGFCSAIFWKALRQPTIFAGIEMQESKKYTVSAVTPEERDTLATVLKKTVAEEQLYLNPDLTIDQLSDRLKTSPRKISQVVNEVFGQNFFDFVNSYRIEKAKQTLSESVDSRLTILEVMYQSGFNSKSSFNTIFKQKTGLTPSEFRKRNRPGRP